MRKRLPHRTAISLPPVPTEICAFGEFVKPWRSILDETNALDRGAALGRGLWHPSTEDLEAVANTANLDLKTGKLMSLVEVRKTPKVEDLLDFILHHPLSGGPKIERENGSIGRLNIFGHGRAGSGSSALVGLRGDVLYDGKDGNVQFHQYAKAPPDEIDNPTVNQARKDVIMGSPIIDGWICDWLMARPLPPEDELDENGKRRPEPEPLIAPHRKKFAKGAEIWLVICNLGLGGSDGENLCRSIAKVFGVTVRAYNDEVYYHPDYIRGSISCSAGRHVAEKRNRDPLKTITDGPPPPPMEGCYLGRNVTSLGRDGKQGRGYFTLYQKVAEPLRGTHMANAGTFVPWDQLPAASPPTQIPRKPPAPPKPAVDEDGIPNLP